MNKRFFYAIKILSRESEQRKLVLLFIFIWGAGDGELALFV